MAAPKMPAENAAAMFQLDPRAVWTLPSSDAEILDRRACLRISESQIVEMLDLPAGTRIRGVRASFDPAAFEVVIVHPDLPVAARDAEAPRLPPPTVTVERKTDEADVVWHRSTVSWGF